MDLFMFAFHHNHIIREILIDLKLKMEEEDYRLGKFLLNLLEMHTSQVKCHSRTELLFLILGVSHYLTLFWSAT